MLTGKELILATRAFAKEKTGRSWFHTITTIGALCISLSATVFIHFFPLQLFLSVITGLLMVRMFIIYHDHQHHSILHNSVIADVIMTGFGLFILSPTSIWKRSHDHHHKNNSKLFGASIGSFPIATTEKFRQMSKSERFAYLATRHPVTIALGYFSMFIYGMCLSSFFSNPKKHFDGLLAPVLHISVSVFLFWLFGWQTWLCVFFLPFLVSLGFGSYLFYAQHNFPGVTFSTSTDWCYERAALESSSYMVMNPVMAWFTGNIGYHHIHHLNAKIPFYRLPETMKAIPEVRDCKRTSLNPRCIIACLRLKCWDPVSGSMVGLRQMA